MKPLAMVAACALLALPAAGAAQTKTVVNARGSGMPNTVVSRTKEGKVCKSVLITGSRLGSTSVCKSKNEWDDQAALYRRGIERLQLNPSKVVIVDP